MTRSLHFAAAVLLAAAPVAAQDTTPLPHDPDVRVGQLENGLRYWVRENREPEDRLELRLMVRAGSILEDDDQQGLAHFLEHMAFNGTTKFAKNELVKVLESIGVRFGADLNAYTSFDETVYILPIPSDKPELVTLAFDVLQDWAGGVLNDSLEVVNERGVVMGEWRSGLGAQQRVQDKEFPILFAGSRYAERLPIGDTATIAHAEPGPLRRFYSDWYRPELMGVIAVGDYPADSLEAMIKSRFSGLTNPSNSRSREVVPVPENPGTRFSSITDPELSSESVQLLIRRPSRGYQTKADERQSLVESIVSRIAGERLLTVARDPETPFAFGSFGLSTLVRDIRVFAIQASAKDGQLLESFEAVLLELRRLVEHGVLAGELDRAKANLLRGRQRSVLEANNTASASYVSRYSSAFLMGRIPISAFDRQAIAAELLPMISLDEVNATIGQMALGEDRFIAIRAPEREGQLLPSESSMLSVLDRVDTATVEPWIDAVVEGPLVAAAPAPGSIVEEQHHDEVGVTEWMLSNGVRVLVKPTDFKADQIVMTAFRPGGTSLLTPDEEFQAGFGSAVMSVSGVGEFDPPALAKRLAGKVARVQVGITSTEEVAGGSTTPADLPLFMELLWLNLTTPRFDSSAVEAFLNQLRPQFVNRDRVPSTAFSDSITLILGQGSPRSVPLDLARFESLESRRAYDLFRSRFEGLAGATFAFVGNVDTADLRPLVEQWLGGLPDGGNESMWRDVAPPYLSGATTTIVRKGQEPTSTSAIIFNGPASATDINARLSTRIAGSILQTRLLELLREAMGGTYGAQATARIDRIPRSGYLSQVIFTSSPEQADSMWQAARGAIEAFQANGPTAEELANALEQERRSTEQQMESNNAWATMLTGRVRFGEPFQTLLEWEANLDAVTEEDVRRSAGEAFALERMARIVLSPES